MTYVSTLLFLLLIRPIRLINKRRLCVSSSKSSKLLTVM